MYWNFHSWGVWDRCILSVLQRRALKFFAHVNGGRETGFQHMQTWEGEPPLAWAEKYSYLPMIFYSWLSIFNNKLEANLPIWNLSYIKLHIEFIKQFISTHCSDLEWIKKYDRKRTYPLYYPEFGCPFADALAHILFKSFAT